MGWGVGGGGDSGGVNRSVVKQHIHSSTHSFTQMHPPIHSLITDAQQNETLVKRHMRKGDLYVHADLHGASTTIVKNSDPGKPVSPLTLHQVRAAVGGEGSCVGVGP